MPVSFEHNINKSTRLIVWHLLEPEDFFLSEAKIQTSINHPQKRKQHLAGRFLLKYLFNDFPYNQLIVDAFGKPRLKNEQYYFSISHADNYVAAIVSKNYNVGIDVEMIQPRALKIIPKFLNNEEQNNLVIDNERDATLCWSIKEAVYKYYGGKMINFKEQIHIYPFKVCTNGRIEVGFRDNDIVHVQYQFLNNLILSWVIV